MPTDILAHIRWKIATGSLPLPRDAPGKVWVGKGNGDACDVCDEAVTSAEIEYELDVKDRTLRFHRKCLNEWQQLRAEELRGSGS